MHVEPHTDPFPIRHNDELLDRLEDEYLNRQRTSHFGELHEWTVIDGDGPGAIEREVERMCDEMEDAMYFNELADRLAPAV